MLFEGQVIKMTTEVGAPIQYYLNLGGDLIAMNQLIGRNIKIKHVGFQCVECMKEKPIYRMGFCKQCFFESPYASETIIRPELSKAHLGIEERNLAVEQEIQLQPHIVYLAYTGEVKVGVTRKSQVPTRWIDQGATFALVIAETENRYEAGVIEATLKQHLSDKTNYRKMLQDEFESDLDLENFRSQVYHHFPEQSLKFFKDDSQVMRLDYPYEASPKITAFTLDKKPEFEGVLKGIKGQYLAFEGGNCINVRGHEGYVIQMEV